MQQQVNIPHGYQFGSTIAPL